MVSSERETRNDPERELTANGSALLPIERVRLMSLLGAVGSRGLHAGVKKAEVVGREEEGSRGIRGSRRRVHVTPR